MKKLSVLLLSAAMMTIFTAPGFAQLRKDLATVKGSVVNVNALRTEVTVQDMVSGKNVTFNYSGVPADIVTGSPVVVIYKVGTTNATTVRLVKGARAASVTPVSAYQAPKQPAKTQSTATPSSPAKTTTEKPSKYGW